MKNSRKALLVFAVFVAVSLAALGIGWSAGLIAFPNRAQAAVPRTFPQMVAEAQASVPMITPAEAYQKVQSDPNTLIIDPRDAADIAATTGLIKGAVNISLGTLTYKADTLVPEGLRDPRLADRSRPIITACYSGELGLLAGKLLKDMGFTNVYALKGGTVAWKAAGYPTQ